MLIQRAHGFIISSLQNIFEDLFFLITSLIFRDDHSQSQRLLHRNRKDMTSHAFPR